jgi:hypothetical protein
MTLSTVHSHAEFDRYPRFLDTIRDEFPDDCEAIASDIIDAELGDFCWESRIAERSNGVIETFDFGACEEREEVSILGYFRGRYLVATCILDAERHLRWMPKVRHFEAYEDAESAFLTPT